MAGLLEFVGDVPEYVRKAAQNKLAEKAASDARKVSVMAYEGGMRPSVTKAANNALKEYAKGSLKYEGGMRESVRKAAERALQGGAAEVAPAAAKTGLLGLTSSVAGPLTTVASAAEMLQGDKPYQTNPRMANQLGMDQELYQGNMAKGFPQDPTGMSQRAVQAGKKYQSEMLDKGEALRAKRMYDTMANAKIAQVESQRQVVEAGAKERLRTNQLSRPKAAEEVVKADIARSGEKVTPQEFKTRVQKEVSSMKTMDDNQLSKYLSYALIAGGLIASHLDKSGNAGKAFAGGFNAQVDRNQQMAMYKEQQKAKAEADAAQAALEERKIGIQEADVGSKISKRESDATLAAEKNKGLLDKWAEEARIANEKLGAYRERTAATAGDSGKQIKGTPLSDKDNLSAIDAYADAKGIKIDPAAKASLATQLKFLQKERPGNTMEKYISNIFKQGGYTKTTEDGWFSDTDVIQLQ